MYNAMNLTEIALRYKVSTKTLKKWISHFCPDLTPAPTCEIYTPEQVKQIVIACGEFPETPLKINIP